MYPEVKNIPVFKKVQIVICKICVEWLISPHTIDILSLKKTHIISLMYIDIPLFTVEGDTSVFFPDPDFHPAFCLTCSALENY